MAYLQMACCKHFLQIYSYTFLYVLKATLACIRLVVNTQSTQQLCSHKESVK